MGNFRASDIRVQDIDHCGIIAGICDEMELVQQIDQQLGVNWFIPKVSQASIDTRVAEGETRRGESLD